MGRPRRRWEDNIGMGLKEIDINTRNWVNSVQDRDYWRGLMNTAQNLWVPQFIEVISYILSEKKPGIISIVSLKVKKYCTHRI